MWKIILIEVLGNSIWFFALISIAFALATLFYVVYHVENNKNVN